MRIIVRPRRLVNQLDLDVRHVVISISDPWDPAVIKKVWGQLGVLHLEFYDLNPAVDVAEEAVMPGGKTVAETVMQPTHGRQVWEFLEKYPEAEAIVIHCDAAVGRSPSMARAICDARGWPRSCIDPIGAGDARNQHVYWVTKSAGRMIAQPTPG